MLLVRVQWKNQVVEPAQLFSGGNIMPQIFGSSHCRRIYGEFRTLDVLLLFVERHITEFNTSPQLCRNDFDADIILI